jgi:hypothetical protein
LVRFAAVDRSLRSLSGGYIEARFCTFTETISKIYRLWILPYMRVSCLLLVRDSLSLRRCRWGPTRRRCSRYVIPRFPPRCRCNATRAHARGIVEVGGVEYVEWCSSCSRRGLACPIARVHHRVRAKSLVRNITLTPPTIGNW